MNWEEIFKKYAVDTLEFVKSGKDVAITQGQLYIEELIKWEIVSGLMTFIFFALVGCVCIFAIRSAAKLEDTYENIDRRMGSFIFGAIFLIVSIVFSTAGIMGSSKAYFAPRVVVMEKLQKMIK